MAFYAAFKLAIAWLILWLLVSEGVVASELCHKQAKTAIFLVAVYGKSAGMCRFDLARTSLPRFVSPRQPRKAGASWARTNSHFFGWLCTSLPLYPDTLHLKTHVHTRPLGERPLVELEPTDHPLAVEQRTGITMDRVRKIAESLLHGREKADSPK